MKVGLKFLQITFYGDVNARVLEWPKKISRRKTLILMKK